MSFHETQAMLFVEFFKHTAVSPTFKGVFTRKAIFEVGSISLTPNTSNMVLLQDFPLRAGKSSAANILCPPSVPESERAIHFSEN
jgi:hypothetical protein